MMVALVIWSAHQKRCEGTAWVYSEVTMRCIKWTVRAKSRTSLERAIRTRMNMALAIVSGMQPEALQDGSPGEAVQHPDQPQRPSDGRVAAQRLPAEHQVQAHLLAGHQGGEDDEHGGARIVGELEEDNLGCDARGREVGEGAGSWRAASAGHECAGGARVLSS